MENLVRSIRRLQQRLQEADIPWLRHFEQALNDSTLVAEYTRLRAGG